MIERMSNVTASLVGVAVGAVIGAVALLLSAWVTSKNQFKLQSEAIKQDRYASAYLTLQLFVNGWTTLAQWHVADPRTTGEPPVPADIGGEAEAIAALHASDEVIAATEEFIVLVASFNNDRNQLEWAKQNRRAVEGYAPDISVENALATKAAGLVIPAGEKVHQLMRAELRINRK